MEPECFVQVSVLTYSRECESTLGGGQLESIFANYTHIIVSVIKAWNVTVVGIECDNAAF